MRKCSRSAHTTMTEMNITPLLDLAFVLLVIFILTTTPITNDLALELPKAAPRSKPAVMSQAGGRIAEVLSDSKAKGLTVNINPQNTSTVDEILEALRPVIEKAKFSR